MALTLDGESHQAAMVSVLLWIWPNLPLLAQIRKRGQVASRQECMETCLAEGDFQCR